MLAAALGKDVMQSSSDAGGSKRGVSAAARNAVVAEAYPESEAYAGAAAGGKHTVHVVHCQ